jgi:hypothetical protein
MTKRYQRGNQNPYIEEVQTTQCPKENKQKDKQRSTKHTYKTTGTRIPDTPFSSFGPSRDYGMDLVWKNIFEPFIHILQHFVLQLSRSTNFCF